MKLLITLFRIGGWGALTGAAITMVIGAVASSHGTPGGKEVATVCLISFFGNCTLGIALLLVARCVRRRGGESPPRITQRGTALSGGPAVSFANPGITGGPPSVS